MVENRRSVTTIMRKNHGYNEGRFSIPPKFDFKIIPFNSKKTTVLSFIGDCDTCFGDHPALNISTYSPLHFHHKTSSGAYVDGFHDCEKQIIYLLLNNPMDLKAVLQNLGDRPLEQTLLDLDHTYLKLIYYLFSVSHFVVISSVGVNLDPSYIRLFRLLDKITVKMQHSANGYLRNLPVPRDWICLGRATIPRLLFVFKASVSLTRKLTPDPDSVRTLEQNLCKQIFNTFSETGVISNNPLHDLFMLPGHNFAHVILANEYTADMNPTTKNSVPQACQPNDDLAQGFMEILFANLGMSALLGDEALAAACRPPQAPCKPALPPPPGQPEEHSLRCFLNLHVVNWLDQVSLAGAGSGPGGYGGGPNSSGLAHELPTCKAWFMACYKLYTSLMSDDTGSSSGASGLANEPLGHLGDSASDIGLSHRSHMSLAQAWQRTLATLSSSGPLPNTPTMVAKPNSLLHSGGDELQQQQPAPAAQPKCRHGADTLTRLCELRCRAAMTTAEAHYKQDLPIHYSHTYHLIKLIASFNVFTSQVRGSALMFRSMEQLCQRLTHLYLAGRVTCTALSLTRHPCQHELHRLPDESAVLRGLRVHLCPAGERSGKACAGDGDGDGRLLEKPDWQLINYMIPSGVSGKWRALWLDEAIRQPIEDRPKAQGSDPATKDDGEGANMATDAQNHQEERLTVMRHHSDSVLLSACSCGRQQSERADPFDYVEANWRFYSLMADACCSRLLSIPLAPQYLHYADHCFCLPDETPPTGRRRKPSRSAQAKSGRALLTDHVTVLTNQMTGLQCSTRGVADADLSPQRLVKMMESAELHDADLSQLDQEPAVNKTGEGEEEERDNRAASIGEETVSIDLFDDSDSSGSLNRAIDASFSAADMDELVKVHDDDDDDDNGDADGCSGGGGGAAIKPGLLRLPAGDSQQPAKSTAAATSDSSNSEPVATVAARFRHGIPTTQWLVGELPFYPSWSIYTQGKYFSYSHYSGLSFRGFLRNSNFLLPWDVSVNPKPWDSDRQTACAPRPVRGARSKDMVKLFIGVEMECPLGHRFFLAGPHRPMDGPMQVGQVRQAVHGLLTKDLPLYFPCRCQRSSSDKTDSDATSTAAIGNSNLVTGSSAAASGADQTATNWAQLTRLYLAIPSAPLRVRLQPRVRPGPAGSTPVFHLGTSLDQCRAGLASSVGSDLDLGDIDRDTDGGEEGDEEEANEIHLPSSAWAHKPESRVDRPTGDSHQAPGFVLLENGFLWVVRLPFAYHDGTRLYERPKTVEQMKQCKLLRGCIKLEQI